MTDTEVVLVAEASTTGSERELMAQRIETLCNDIADCEERGETGEERYGALCAEFDQLMTGGVSGANAVAVAVPCDAGDACAEAPPLEAAACDANDAAAAAAARGELPDVSAVDSAEIAVDASADTELAAKLERRRTLNSGDERMSDPARGQPAERSQFNRTSGELANKLASRSKLNDDENSPKPTDKLVLGRGSKVDRTDSELAPKLAQRNKVCTVYEVGKGSAEGGGEGADAEAVVVVADPSDEDDAGAQKIAADAAAMTAAAATPVYTAPKASKTGPSSAAAGKDAGPTPPEKSGTPMCFKLCMPFTGKV